jgi:hypothetical protein
MGCVAGAYPGAVCSCRECRSTCPALNRRCSPGLKCDDCIKDDRDMDRILKINIKATDALTKFDKLSLAKKKVIDSVREYRLLLETDKNEKLEEVLRELTII